MRKSGFIAMVALLIAAIGVLIALAAYFKNRSSYLYDDDDD
jgi:Na+/proline symporter